MVLAPVLCMTVSNQAVHRASSAASLPDGIDGKVVIRLQAERHVGQLAPAPRVHRGPKGKGLGMREREEGLGQGGHHVRRAVQKPAVDPVSMIASVGLRLDPVQVVHAIWLAEPFRERPGRTTVLRGLQGTDGILRRVLERRRAPYWSHSASPTPPESPDSSSPL